MKSGEARRIIERKYKIFLKKYKNHPTVIEVSPEFFEALKGDLWAMYIVETRFSPTTVSKPESLAFRASKVYKDYRLEGTNMVLL